MQDRKPIQGKRGEGLHVGKLYQLTEHLAHLTYRTKNKPFMLLNKKKLYTSGDSQSMQYTEALLWKGDWAVIECLVLCADGTTFSVLVTEKDLALVE